MLWQALSAALAVALAASLSGNLPPVSGPSGLWGVYDTSLRGAKYIDLTHAFSPGIPLWPGFKASTVGPARSGQDLSPFAALDQAFTYLEHGLVATAYQLNTDQIGTQLDPPAHWNEYGATVSDIPATFAVRPLVVVDVTDKVKADPTYQAQPEDVLAWEAKHGTVPRGSVVFFRSGWGRDWPKIPKVVNGVSLAALKLIHDERGIMLHGHEPLDTDNTPNLEGEAWLLHNNYAQAEGVANLHLVPEKGCLVSVGFAKPEGGTGGYARYVAICPPSHPHGQTIDEAPGAPLPVQPHPLRRDTDGVMRPKKGAEPTEYCTGKGAENAAGCAAGKPAWL
mmetsp:Transcript_20365/g.69317  ORF Transcript_20365/g.69317 Transcript_20365/m.69317 type:complete len:337 (+) Transcript_20365:265-1275(+)